MSSLDPSLRTGAAVVAVLPLVETGVSSSLRAGDVYLNVWNAPPTVDELEAIVAGELQMPIGYRSLEVIERLDSLRFSDGVRARFQRYAEQFVGRATKNIVVVRAGGFAGTVIHGVVGIFNAVGVKTPVFTDLDDAIVTLHDRPSTTTPDLDALRTIVAAHVAAHVARVPRA